MHAVGLQHLGAPVLISTWWEHSHTPWPLVQVKGDAFIARVRDDGDNFERMDFLVSELSSDAPWVHKARNQNERKRREVSAHSIVGLVRDGMALQRA